MNAKQIKEKLDKIVIGQEEQKKKLIMVIMQRFKRLNIKDTSIKETIRPFNILIKGPSGSGKTYTISQLSKILNIPFYKTSLTQYSETGYVGKNVEDIFKDLYRTLYPQINKTFYNKMLEDKETLKTVCQILANIYLETVGTNNSESDEEDTNENMSLDDLLNVIDKKTSKNSGKHKESIRKDIINTLMNYYKTRKVNSKDDEILLNTMLQIRVKKRISVRIEPFGSKFVVKPVIITKPIRELYYDICEDMIYSDTELYDLYIEYVKNQLENSIVFLDEIDKIADKNEDRVSRGGVQNGLLTILSGTDIYLDDIDTTISTNHVLFIAAGAFQSGVQINDLKDEILGRFPIIIEMNSLTKDDYFNILKYAKNNVLEQQINLLKFNGISVDVDDEVISKIAEYTEELNKINNIGARRLVPFVVELLSEFIYSEMDELMTDEKINELKDKYGECKLMNKNDDKYIYVNIKFTDYVKNIIDTVKKNDIDKFKASKKISL